MNKIVFLSFADKRYAPSLNRIKKDATKFNLFDEIYALDESSFEKKYFETHKKKFLNRGFGYWMWKSYLVRKTLENLDENDILFYADSGCNLNFKGLNRFKEYLHLLERNEMGLLVFKQDLKENNYTKSDVFSFFGVLEDKKITHANQIWAGSFLLRKTKKSVDFINQWYNTCHDNFYLINDKPSKVSNFDDFIGHRHDQSVFSVLCKLNQPEFLSIDECYPSNKDWNTMEKRPIWAIRNKEMSLFSKFIHRAKYPLRKIHRYFEEKK
jgi:hypothetical protein